MSEGPERPPAGAPIVVRLIDATYADAPARPIAEARGQVGDDEEEPLTTVELASALAPGADLRVRAHVDVDEDGAVSPGDFVTTASYPARGDEAMRVVVRRV